jgi:hypothetical protein
VSFPFEARSSLKNEFSVLWSMRTYAVFNQNHTIFWFFSVIGTVIIVIDIVSMVEV